MVTHALEHLIYGLVTTGWAHLTAHLTSARFEHFVSLCISIQIFDDYDNQIVHHDVPWLSSFKFNSIKTALLDILFQKILCKTNRCYGKRKTKKFGFLRNLVNKSIVLNALKTKYSLDS